MKTVGEILKKARGEKRITYEEIEKNLRIRKKFLIALEDNAWDKLPSLPYIKGFIRSYSNYLGLKPDQMLAIFRRQFRQQEKAGLLPEGLTHPLDEPVFHYTPQMAIGSVIALFTLFFFGYLFLQYQSFTSAPELTVNTPSEGAVISSDKIQVQGKSNSDAVVSINGQKVALSDKGEFSLTMTLTPGINTVSIEAIGKNGKKRTVSRTIQIQSD